MSYLTPRQMQLLRELDIYGGTLIVRSRKDDRDYLHLQNAGLVSSSTMFTNEVHYKITDAGRAVLREATSD
jgi:hypothetical protein